MKNLDLYLKVFAVAALLALPSVRALAQVSPPPGPTTPTLDFLESVQAYAEAAAKTMQQGATIADSTQTQLNKGLQVLEDFPGKIKLDASALQKEKNEPNIAIAREDEFGPDEQTVDQIAAKFKTLFLIYPFDIINKYPNDTTAIRKAYEDEGRRFGDDAILEMYLVVRNLEDRMEELKKEFDALSACYVQSDTSSGSALCQGASDDGSSQAIWGNYAKMNIIYDQMLQIAEELYAIKAQYEVAQAMRRGLEPLEENMQDQNSDAGTSGGESTETPSEKSADASDVLHYSRSFSGAHAQLWSSKELTTTAEPVVVEQETVAATENKKEIGKFDIVKAKPSVIYTPLTGTIDKFKELAISANTYDQILLAKNLHNLKQQMPGMRESFVEANKMKQMHEKAIEKLKESETCIVNYLGKYYADPQKVWLGSGCHYSGTKVICRTDRKMTAQNLQTLKTGDISCPDGSGQICSSFIVNEYGKRGGFSGWLISAYKTAKAEKTVEINQEDISPAMFDLNNTAKLDDFNDPEKMTKKGLSDVEVSDSPWVTPSKSLEFESQSREADMVVWQIGAEGAKALGKDMASSNPKWGTVTNPYPIWNDEKYFYDQYLEEKYRNMKLFIQGLDMSEVILQASQQISDSLTGTMVQGLSIVKAKSFNSQVFGKTKSLMENAQEDSEENPIQKVRAENELKLRQTEVAFDQKMLKLEKSKQGVYDVLDEHSIELSDQKKAYNESVSEAKTAEVMIDSQHTALKINQNRKSILKDLVSGFASQSESLIAENKQSGAKAVKAQEDMEVQIEFSREKIDDAKNDLENVEQNIEQAKSNYALEASKIEDANLQQINKALIAMETGSTAPLLGQNPLFKQALNDTPNAGALQKVILSAVVALADNYAGKAKQQMIEKIDEAYAEIEELGEDRYKPVNHELLVEIHQDLINELKNMPTLEAIDTTLPIGAINTAVSALYQNYLTSAICGDGLCMAVDEEYFVGLPPKSRDFMAPNKIVTSYTAPLREVVHFDLVDYHNLVKSDNGETTRGEFLNYGQDLPQIWEKILNSKGFVERDVDISKFLRNNAHAGDMLLRGGTYPCKIAKRIIDIGNGGFLVYMDEGEDVPVCKGIKSAVMYSNGNIQLVFNNGDRGLAHSVVEKPDYQASELSQLLKYNQGVAVSEKMTEIANFFEDLEGETDPDEYGVKGRLFENALLDRNQFGNYLTFVEMESVYQNGIDELDVKLDESREKINEQLSKVGHQLKKGFDLADDETYDAIMKLLDQHKNKVMNAAINDVNQISAENDYLKERKDKLLNLIKAMQMDSDELLQISDNVTADEAFAEQIKQKQTDQKVMGKFKEEAQAEFEKQLESFEEPYCAVY